MAKVMTKSQVVSHLAEEAGIQKKAAAAVLAEIASLATRECKRSGQFVIPGLGKAVKARLEYRRHNQWHRFTFVYYINLHT